MEQDLREIEPTEPDQNGVRWRRFESWNPRRFACKEHHWKLSNEYPATIYYQD